MLGIALTVKRALRKFGFDIIRYDPARYPAMRRRMLMHEYGINVVFDIGSGCDHTSDLVDSISIQQEGQPDRGTTRRSGEA